MGCGASRSSAPPVAPAPSDAAPPHAIAPSKAPLPLDPPNRPRGAKKQAGGPPPPPEPEGPPPKDNASRGVTYDQHIDHKVHRLYGPIGERLLWAVCYKFYSLVESDTEQPDFAEVFSTPAARASELLCWYLMEAWGGPAIYSKARGSHFSFLYSVHSIWRFNLTEKYWQRWIHHFLAAAEHYCVLLEQAAAAAQQAGEALKPPPLVLPKMSARYAELRKQMSLAPMEDELTRTDEHEGAAGGGAPGSACPFAKLAPPGAQLPLGHQPTHTPASVEDQYRVPEVTLVDARDVGAITRDDLVTMRYYLSRLREWLDVPLQTELDKNKYVAVFD